MKIQQLHSDGVPTSDQLTALAQCVPQLVMVFASVGVLDSQAFQQDLKTTFPDALRLGCSTAGEIGPDGVTQGGCVVSAVRFERDVKVKLAQASAVAMEDSHGAGLSLGTQLAEPQLRAVMLLGKGVKINGSALIRGVVEAVGANLPITGGLAGDDGTFERTLVLGPDGVCDDGVVALGLYGEALALGYGSVGGWMAFGPARKVTRSEGNILYELDGEPALNVYKRYLGDYADQLPASGLLFPFEMLNENHDTLGLIRTILGIDEASGSLTLAGEIAADGYLRLMHASVDDLVDGADRAATQTRALLPGHLQRGLAVLVSCVGRRLVMGDQVDDEVDAVLERLGADTAVCGFYSYGEISPLSTSVDCKLHNQTMTVTYIGEV